MRSRKTRSVPKSHALAYLGKAAEFMAVADRALEEGHWDATGLNAVHCVISAADAVMVYRGGMRSADADHRAARDLLETAVGAEGKGALRHMSVVLVKKNLVEYERRRLMEKEARDMATHAHRFLDWARDMLPPGA